MSGVPPRWPHPKGFHQCCAITPGRKWEINKRASGETSRRCQRVAREQIADKWFCYAHAPRWQTHYEILDRIRSL